MLSTLIYAISISASAPSYLVEWTTTQMAAGQRIQESSEFTLSEGQVFKRVDRVTKTHLRNALEVRIAELDDDSVRIEASVRDRNDPRLVEHLVLTARLDSETLLKRATTTQGAPALQMRVRVHRSGDTGPTVTRTH